MAPRRGGSTSVGGGGGTNIENRCSGSIFFDSDQLIWTVPELVEAGVFLVAFSVLLVLYIKRWRRAAGILQWWQYGLALAFTIM